MQATGKLSERLETVRGDTPREIRNHALNALCEEIEADIAVFFKCAVLEGRWHYTSSILRGDPEATALFDEYMDGPVLPSPWTCEHVDAGQISTFIRCHDYFPTDYLYGFDAQVEMMRPLEITDELRSVFFDGRKFYGWLGLMRRDDEREFSDEEEQIANAALERFKSALLAAESLERGFFEPGPIFVVLRANGRIERASWRAKEWLTGARIDELGRLVRRYDCGRDERPTHVIRGATLHLTRLDGDSDVRYLAHLDRAALGAYDPMEQLTDRQREVVEYAAAGATNDEIARTLEVTRPTVKYHLQQVYSRLGLRGRVDLAGLC